MPVYVVLSNFTDLGRTDVKSTSDRLDRLAPVAEKMGVKVLANAITMGAYDVVTVMEAADDATIAKVIGTVLSRGYVTTQTMRGFSIDEFRESPPTWAEGRKCASGWLRASPTAFLSTCPMACSGARLDECLSDSV